MLRKAPYICVFTVKLKKKYYFPLTGTRGKTVKLFLQGMKYRMCHSRIQSVVGDHFSSPNIEIKEIETQKDTLVHSLNCVFFKYRLKSSVFIVTSIYGVDDCGK
jgi:hypothetical protein